ELLTLCTVPLVWHKRDEESTKAALTYMLYLIGGAAVGFAAVVLLPWAGGEDGRFFPCGNLPMQSLQTGYSMGGAMGDPARFFVDQKMQWIALLGFVGFGVKAAVLPLCRWLPKASVAPTPVTALLHAVAVVNAGVFAVLRVLYYELPPAQISGHWAQTVMLILSAATLLYAAVMAVREQHVKRRLAWSTVSNLSYMLLGLSLLSQAGMTAGLSHMIFHSLAKIILFFCAGAVLTQTNRTQVRQMHGLGRKLPLTFAAFTVAGLSLVGVPPLPGFVSKYALVTAAFEEGGLWPIAGAVALMIATVLTVIYIMTVVFPAFFMKYHPGEGETAPRDPGLCMKAALIGLCILLIAASLCAGKIMGDLKTLAGGGAL
ncbi:MAG: proton-conducting membrane transporter, partial [Clostridia bacterium]|nr:proton-conducting membrane transporter [Clostridia bacterium]